jgi:putative intracellular protease/amidase
MINAKKHALMIVTSQGSIPQTGERTGFWMEEFASPYLEFERAGFELTVASPRGGEAPVDPRSLNGRLPVLDAIRNHARAQHQIKNTVRLDQIGEKYDVYFMAGGHGCMWDFPDNMTLRKMLPAALLERRIVAAVCHAPAGFVHAMLPSGHPMISGMRLTGFTNEEERQTGLEKVMPFLLETHLRERGAIFESGRPWTPFVVSDEYLVTGQNPESSTALALEVVRVLHAIELTATP